MGERKRKMARIQSDLERRKLLASKICWAVVCFIAGLFFVVWFPIYCACIGFESNKPFWKD
jgi:hypothetical protein